MQQHYHNVSNLILEHDNPIYNLAHTIATCVTLEGDQDQNIEDFIHEKATVISDVLSVYSHRISLFGTERFQQEFWNYLFTSSDFIFQIQHRIENDTLDQVIIRELAVSLNYFLPQRNPVIQFNNQEINGCALGG